MAIRTPTPELIDALRQDNEITGGQNRHARHLFPPWVRTLVWGVAIAVVAAIVWRFSDE